MKTLLLILVPTLWLLDTQAFSPSAQLERNLKFALAESKHSVESSIAKELKDLDGHSQNHPDSHDTKGLSEYHENLVHKLRKDLWDKEKLLHSTLDKLEASLKGEAMAFEVAELGMHELEEYREENESIRRLIWQACKLAGRRVKKATKFVVTLGRSARKNKEQ